MSVILFFYYYYYFFKLYAFIRYTAEVRREREERVGEGGDVQQRGCTLYQVNYWEPSDIIKVIFIIIDLG